MDVFWSDGYINYLKKLAYLVTRHLIPSSTLDCISSAWQLDMRLILCFYEAGWSLIAQKVSDTGKHYRTLTSAPAVWTQELDLSATNLSSALPHMTVVCMYSKTNPANVVERYIGFTPSIMGQEAIGYDSTWPWQHSDSLITSCVHMRHSSSDITLIIIQQDNTCNVCLWTVWVMLTGPMICS